MSSVERCEYSFNILLTGDVCVGKTSLMFKFVDKPVENVELGSQGLEMKKIVIGDTRVRLVIYDTSGVPKLRPLTRGYYGFSVGILLLYSIEDRNSFHGLRSWLEDFGKSADPGTVITLLGCKCDSVSERVVSKDDGARLAKEYGINFLEVSAKTGYDVEAAFRITAISILARVLDGTIDRKKVKHSRERAVF
ncbi:unnamed protein product [Nesidiocoris tenuis]|uniref:GTP-binding protein n=1 Tax=Nesidiocoris tenuis TaxID=355587 RepID=A0A6H5G232_9HEMI|nr:unnamed protein product [Nesidiocoris tenuis]